jgi:hypothetical protein
MDLFQLFLVFSMLADAAFQTIYAFFNPFITTGTEVVAYIFLVLHHIIAAIICIWLAKVSNMWNMYDGFVKKTLGYSQIAFEVIFRLPVWKLKEEDDSYNLVDYMSMLFINIPQVLLLDLPFVFIAIHDANLKGGWDFLSLVSIISSTSNILCNGILYASQFRKIVNS